MSIHPIVAPVIALAAWTHLIFLWMYGTRLPAMFAMKMKMDPNIPNADLMATLPPRVRWKADNYNHLCEQPTVFYAVALSLAVLGEAGSVNTALAWGYVGLRIVHSLVQVLWNKLAVRFALFALCGLTLIVLTLNAARALF